MKKLLLHICCAPCLISVLGILQYRKYEVIGFHYNPCIHPKEEFERRKNVLIEYVKKINLKMYFYPEYEDKVYFKSIAKNQIAPQRCRMCWLLRLKKTAQQAKKLNIKVFTTTLLTSPYQDLEIIRQMGEKAGREFGVEFMFENFRKGYTESVRISKELNMYRQKYCGCIFSLNERNQKIKQKVVKNEN
ncbi:MAG: hypothetical protein DRP78_00740 [Candidatus Omnitrophota bacterium]|nr:MAG: hypothetical protein DRP78_00740 [Candidatus Omnitrophota bacterium]